MARTRQHQIQLYLDDAEKKKLQKDAAAAGLSNSAYLRQCLLEQEVKAQPSEWYKKLHKLLYLSCNNLNQLTRYIHMSGCLVSEQDLAKTLQELQKLLIRIGRE